MEVAQIKQQVATTSSGTGNAGKTLQIALIVHGVTALVILLHWLFAWFICPLKLLDVCFTPTTTLYTWTQLVAILLIIGAVVVNIGVEKAKGEAKLTSYLALAHCVLGIYYLIGFWFLTTGKALRTDGQLFQKILFYLYQALWIACIVVPAFMGGLK